jgi:hypothetical protein
MRWLCPCLLTAVLVGAGAALARIPGRAEAGDLPPAAARYELRGAGSCAAAACHNGNGQPGDKGSEYTTWVLRDPHSHAFEVLYGEKSRQIEKNRQHPPGVKEDHPESDPLCLNCHVLPGIEPTADGGERLPRRRLFALEDGVSCEACHGAAGGWLTQHYTAAWRDRTPEQKTAEGMTNTKDLRVRAELCVRCHVGAGDIDVNHDLIAAGHPRLAFEYAAFHANLPKHWDARKDKQGRPDFEARQWALGQIVSSRAALALLAHRAEEKNKRPWPEFAEYDCYACHHDLKTENERRDQGPGDAPPWGTWYHALVPEAARGPNEVRTGLTDLAAQMAKPRPDRAEVVRLADVIGKHLRESERGRWDAPAVGTLMRQVAADGRQGWDGAAQVYLALAALNAAHADLDPRFAASALKGELLQMRDLLKLPSTPAGRGYDSPRDFSPTKFRQALEQVRRGLHD